MPAKKPPPPDEKPQRDRFIEAAREHGASEDPAEFERVFRKVMAPQKGAPKPADDQSRPSGRRSAS
jgi:hypothetical protein